jgi:hypothetical protein
VDARSILAEAPDLLTRPQMDAIAGWLDGQNAAERAREQGLAGGEEEATRLLRSGLQRLRRHYAGEHGDVPAKARKSLSHPTARGRQK